MEREDSGGPSVGEGLSARALSDSAAERKKKKSIGADFREKLSSLTRRQTDVTLLSKAMALKDAEKALKQNRPNLDIVLRWGDSFDSLLNDRYGLALFRGFLRTEFSDENIEFWIACEEYKTLMGAKKQHAKSQKIYNEYVAVQAPREVNLDSTTRLQTIQALSTPNKHTFENAQKRIQALMEKDSYQRFLRSELYNSLVREARSHAGSSSGSGSGGGSSSSTPSTNNSTSCNNVDTATATAAAAAAAGSAPSSATSSSTSKA